MRPSEKRQVHIRTGACAHVMSPKTCARIRLYRNTYIIHAWGILYMNLDCALKPF